jgi:L-alanine-DL-glutamate epimerase-like enolase superfamily enzyme
VDAERVQAVREAVGEKVELMIDANYLFSSTAPWSFANW